MQTYLSQLTFQLSSMDDLGLLTLQIVENEEKPKVGILFFLMILELAL